MEGAGSIFTGGLFYRYSAFFLPGLCRNRFALGQLGGGRFLCKTDYDCPVAIPVSSVGSVVFRSSSICSLRAKKDGGFMLPVLLRIGMIDLCKLAAKNGETYQHL